MLQQLDQENNSRGASESEINALPVHILESNSEEIRAQSDNINNNNSNSSTAASAFNRDSCNICLEPYEIGDELRTIPCMHKFHKNCIDKWLRSNATCPVCKCSINDHDEDV